MERNAKGRRAAQSGQGRRSECMQGFPTADTARPIYTATNSRIGNEASCVASGKLGGRHDGLNHRRTM